MRRKHHLPRQPVKACIESFAHDGRGIAHLDGKAVFIDGALPGEEVTFVYTDRRRDYAEGRIDEVLRPSSLRVEPRCPHFGLCGGCSLQHLDADAQVQAKQALLQAQFKRIGKIEEVPLWPALTGPIWGYRRKARLSVKYVAKKERVLVGFREKNSPFLADIKRCEVLHPKVGEKLLELSELILSLTVKKRVPQIEVAVGDERSALVFRILEKPTAEDLEKLRAFGKGYDFDIYLQPKGPESILALEPEEPPLLTYSLPCHQVTFQFAPLEFIQVNAEINRQMVDRVIDVLQLEANDTVLDLFCGLGNFTLPMAKKAGKVIGIEGSDALVKRARCNAERNGLTNTEFHSADLTQPLKGEWATRKYAKLLLDPSRAGASNALTCVSRWGPQRIVYVSCNPATLARDADILVHQHGYRLVSAGVMDMFPHTYHVESIALFER